MADHGASRRRINTIRNQLFLSSVLVAAVATLTLPEQRGKVLDA